MLAGQVVVELGDPAVAQQRAGDLGQGVGERDQRPVGGAQPGGQVRRVQVRRLVAGRGRLAGSGMASSSGHRNQPSGADEEAGVRTQVGIVGAGPAGLLLSHLLHLEGVSSVVLELRSREYVEQRVRAGVLEQGTVELLEAAGVAGRLRREGMVHHGIELRSGGRRQRVPRPRLTGGRSPSTSRRWSRT